MNRRNLALYLGLACAMTTYAADLLVTSDQDSGPGSLRQAITDANATSEADTITFNFSGTITLASTLPPITSMIAVDGSGRNVIISGNNAARVIQVSSAGTLELRRLTIANGFVQGGGHPFRAGPAIHNDGRLTLRNCNVSGNTAAVDLGSIGEAGAIFNSADGILDVSDSTFFDNHVRGNGTGGVVLTYGTAKITRSTFAQNSADAGGGAIQINGGTLDLSNSTLYGNSTRVVGGGVWSGGNGRLSLTNNTIYGNTADRYAGGIAASDLGVVDMANNIVAGNAGGDCHKEGPSVNHTGPNLIQDGSCSAPLTGEPMLGPLADNGGPTQTHALPAGSPAIDAGNDSVCSSSPVDGVDQRGQPRPAGAHCDLGAYEYGRLFQFTGFFPPVGNLPVVNTVKAGQTVPVKFSLGGNQGLDIFAAGYPGSQPENCGAAPVSEIEQAAAAGGSSLSYDPSTDTYTFVWKTEKQWANTCRQLVVKLRDGTTHLASFRLR